MHVDRAFLMCAVIFAALWRESRAASPVPSIPDQLQAVLGSCVVIPCSFTPPAPFWTRRNRVQVKMKYRSMNPFFLLLSTAFNSEDRSQTSLDYLGRTSLFGQTSDGDCSVKIERVREEDARVFEIALKRSGDGSWGKTRSFTLDVLDTPEPPVITGLSAATEGQLVTLNCSVSYHCPSAPPTLRWIWERGTPWNDSEPGEVQTLLLDAHRPMLLTSLSFIATHKVKPRFRCEVRHPGGNALATSKNLHVTFSPKDVVVQVHTMMVQEGGSALLVCSCKADPPASEYHWSYSQHGHVMHLHQRTQTIRVFNVTRDMSVRCSAQNLIGRGQSRPMQLNIHCKRCCCWCVEYCHETERVLMRRCRAGNQRYIVLYQAGQVRCVDDKPVILQLSSSCDVQDMDVLCRCSVESNPKAAVTWSVNGSVPPDDYNISMASEPHNLTVTLQGRMDRPQRVVCFAVNALGNDSLVLLQGEEDTASLLWMVIPAAATCLVLFLLSLLFFCCCRRRAGRQVLSQRPAMYPGEMGIYQDQMPLYINCTEVTHIYTNGSYQLVYQNCTPVFVNTKQTRPIGRRRGERRREGGHVERHGVSGVRDTREVETAAVGDADTGIYLEIL